MKESGEMHLKSTIYESNLSTADAVPLPQWGRLTIRGCRFSRIVKANTGYMEKKNNDEIKPSPRGEGGEQSEPDRVLAV